MSTIRPLRLAVLGTSEWLQRVQSTAGLTTDFIVGSALTAKILTSLGARVAFVSLIGDDDVGQRIRAELLAADVDLTWLTTRSEQQTTRSIVTIGKDGTESSREIIEGSHLVRGDRLDIYRIFDHDLILLDLDDLSLLQFLVDLPAHTVPATRLLGTLTHLAETPNTENLRIALTHDAIVGTMSELIKLTGQPTADDALQSFQNGMRTHNLRTAILLDSQNTIILTTKSRSIVNHTLAPPIDPITHAKFLAGLTFGMAQRWEWEQTITFAIGTASTINNLGIEQ